MTYSAIKSRLERYNKMALFAKSIELITLTALTLLKELYIQSKKSYSIFTSALLQCKSNIYLEYSLLVTSFTNKHCNPIMNNRSIIDVINYIN